MKHAQHKNDGSQPIRMIALDLDGTLLTSDKRLSTRNACALQLAAERGIEIVPTTGRYYDAMPQAVRDLPYVHYAITMNGAQVYDVKNDRVLSRAEMPWQTAVALMEYMDTLPVIYDCYLDNGAWMPAAFKRRAAEFVPNVHYQKMVQELRQPVTELKYFVRTRCRDVQKVQCFIKDDALRQKLLATMEPMFPAVAVSSSLPFNVEINAATAQKGIALARLAEHLHISMEQTMSFGDGTNDLSMIHAAGIGVAMENACEEVLAAADRITADCDADGVAIVIEQLCLQ